MARIRSIHPGLFTDEDFVTLSADAQILYIGLLTEADDDGVFDWKPLTLRMRLRPTKDGPIDTFLSELEAVDKVKRYEVSGHQLGAIRNFRKFQRPKFPKSTHTISDDIRRYVGLTDDATEMIDDDGDEFPRKRRGEERSREKESSLRSPKKSGTRLAEGWRPSEADVDYARSQGVPEVEILREAERFRDFWLGKPGQSGVKLDWPATWRNWVRSACDRRGWKPGELPLNGASPHPTPPKDERDAESRLRVGRERQMWPRPRWGPAPNEAGCTIPAHLVQPGDGRGWAEWTSA